MVDNITMDLKKTTTKIILKAEHLGHFNKLVEMYPDMPVQKAVIRAIKNFNIRIGKGRGF